MRARFIFEDLQSVLRPKSKEEVDAAIDQLSANELLNFGFKNKDKSLIKKAFERGAVIRGEYFYDQLKKIYPELELEKYLTTHLKLKRGIEVENASPEQLFAAAVTRKMPDLIKQALAKKPKNIGFMKHQAMIVALTKGDNELALMLLKNPLYDPTQGGKNQILGGSEQVPVRLAAELGRIEVLKALLKDKRVEPQAYDNRALKYAMKYKRWDSVELLLKDDRVLKSLKGNELKNVIKRLLKVINEV